MASDPEQVLFVEKAAPLIGRTWPSLTTYRDQYIFVSGGWDPDYYYNHIRSLDFYDHATDEWKTGCNLKGTRHSHSSCILNDTLYVLGGF